MLYFAHTPYLRGAIAALAGVMAVPAAIPAEAASVGAAVPPAPLLEAEGAPPAQAPDEGRDDPTMPSESCLTSTICTVKNKVRWGTPAWSPDFCARIARGVLASSKRNGISPSLLLAVAVNESDLDEKAVRVTTRNGKVYAKDSGLMGIRCLVDDRGKCTNGYVRGLSWKTVMDPITNIELGARELARWRKGGVARVTVRVRSGGALVSKQKYVPCHHKTHAFWAHYNHGPVYISKGPARHYPHKVAVLQHALAQALNVDPAELKEVARVTVRDRGERERTADRPVGTQIRKLCSQIREGGGQCATVASLAN